MASDSSTDRYPHAPRLALTEDLFGHEVSDPYRWLEDAASPQTEGWLRSQDELFRQYGSGLPGAARLTERILELTGTGHIGVPVWRGDRQFFTRRLPGQEHAVLCTVDPGTARPGSPEGPGEATAGRTLIDPAAIDPSGKTTLDGWQPDKEGRLLAHPPSGGRREE